ncbi:MAG: hypothetical protein NTZ48_02235 [Candidatus Omnitrophica bacterium]|nr:hypothetical protein [Candidatus Omnitrophota bacterium]
MREIVFKNLNDLERRHKNVFVAETLESEGIVCHSERRTIYVIKEKIHIDDPLNLDAEVKKMQQDNSRTRQIFIRKKFDSKNKSKEFAYSLLGRFYVVVGEDIYAVAFKHTFKLMLLDTGYKKDQAPNKEEAEA